MNEVCFKNLDKENPASFATYESTGGYKVWRKVLNGEISPEDILAELKASGLSLRDYLNKQRGLTRKKPVKKSMGGKVKAYSSGGSVRGGGKARKTNSCTMVTMKGS